MIKQINTFLDKTLEVVVMICMGVLVLDVLWQVFTRKVLNNPSQWTEELAIFLLIWVALLGAAGQFGIFGVFLIVIYAFDRFNTPSNVRASTTAGRYMTSVFLYLMIYLVITSNVLVVDDVLVIADDSGELVETFTGGMGITQNIRKLWDKYA